MKEISHSDISGITTKAPCGVALMGERHVRIEISDFVMRTFVLFYLSLLNVLILNILMLQVEHRFAQYAFTHFMSICLVA